MRFQDVCIMPDNTEHCIYGVSPPRDPGQNPDQKSGQKPGFSRTFTWLLKKHVCFNDFKGMPPIVF